MYSLVQLFNYIHSQWLNVCFWVVDLNGRLSQAHKPLLTIIVQRVYLELCAVISAVTKGSLLTLVYIRQTLNSCVASIQMDTFTKSKDHHQLYPEPFHGQYIFSAISFNPVLLSEGQKPCLVNSILPDLNFRMLFNRIVVDHIVFVDEVPAKCMITYDLTHL